VFINQWTSSYLSNSDPRLHIGLGMEKEIDAIEVTWNDGTRETFPGPPVDRYVTLVRNSASREIVQPGE
jgi:hypothetical protein